jgi:anti-sigma factor RsiW
MTPSHEHLGEVLQDLLDRRLGGVELERAQAHLQVCPPCRRELESLRQVKRALAAYALRQTVPAELGTEVGRMLDREDSRAPAAALGRRWPSRFRWAFGVGLAAAAAFVSVALWVAQRPAGLPAAVARDFAEFQAGTLPLDLHTTEPPELERFFASSGMTFETHVFDLGMMNFRVVGGRVHRTQGRPSTVFVYRGPGDTHILCEMYEGSLDELPPAAETLEHNGIAFQVYRRNGVTAVFWPEGKVICVLVSNLDPAEVIRLAFAKAVKVPA